MGYGGGAKLLKHYLEVDRNFMRKGVGKVYYDIFKKVAIKNNFRDKDDKLVVPKIKWQKGWID